MRIRFFRTISLLLAMLLFLDAGPRQIVETTVDFGGSDVPALSITDRLQFDDLLRSLQTAVAADDPDLDEIAALQRQLAREHENVLAHLHRQEERVRQTRIPRNAKMRLETAVADYQANYSTLTQYLDRAPSDPAALANLAAFLDSRVSPVLHTSSAANLPHQALAPAAPVPAETVVAAVTAVPPKRGAHKTVAGLADDPPSADDLAETIEVQFTPDIVQLAAALNHNPVEVYNWVHNEIDFVPVWGSIQGAQHCLETRICNAFDTSSLLVALLRVSGIPARYQTGSVDVPVAEFMNWAGGFTDPEEAASLFASAGVPDVVRRVDGANSVVSVRLQHVWVKAYVDYIPSRGAVHIAGDTWIEMDAGFKQHQFPTPVDWSQFMSSQVADPAAFRDQLLATAVTDPATGSITGMDTSLIQAAFQPDEDALYSYFTTNYPDASLADLIGRKSVLTETLSVLPANLPYTVLSYGTSTAEIPAGLRHTMEIDLAGANGTSLFTFQGSLPELAGSPITLGYEPASQADRDALAAYMLADPAALPRTLPVGLVDIVPQLIVSGTVLHTGTAVPLGQTQQFQISFGAPTIQTPAISNEILAGETFALGLNPQNMSPALIDTMTARLNAIVTNLQTNPGNPNFDIAELQELTLHTTITNWFNQADLVNGVFADQSRVVTLRYPSLGIAFADYAPNTLFGSPTTLLFTGVAMDIDRDIVVTLSRDGDQEAAVNHTLVTGMMGSQFEADLPSMLLYPMDDNQSDYWLATSSTIAEAIDLQDATLVITSDNFDLVAPTLPLTPPELTEIQDALNAGLTIFMHQTPLEDTAGASVSSQLWFDTETGSASYLISGLGGSVGAECGAFLDMDLPKSLAMGAAADLGAQFVDDVVSQMGGPGKVAGKLASFAYTAYQLSQNINKVEAAVGQIGDSARPLLGMAILFAILDVIKTISINSFGAGLAAGAYLNLVSWTAYKMAAYIIGRIAEVEAAINGIILPPGCLAKSVFPSS